jgi:hypothetical protein
MPEPCTYQLVPPPVNTDLSPLATDLLTALRYSPYVTHGQVTDAGLLEAQTRVATDHRHPGFRLVRAACAELVQHGCLVPAEEGRG